MKKRARHGRVDSLPVANCSRFDPEAVYIHGGPATLRGGKLVRGGKNGQDSGAIFLTRDTPLGRSYAQTYASWRSDGGAIWLVRVKLSPEQVYDNTNARHRNKLSRHLSAEEWRMFQDTAGESGHLDWAVSDEEVFLPAGFKAALFHERDRSFFSGSEEPVCSVGVFDAADLEIVGMEPLGRRNPRSRVDPPLDELRENDILTVYHGTDRAGVEAVLHGVDALQVVPRVHTGSLGRTLPGLFVTPDFETAREFTKDLNYLVVEMRVRAANLHGTDWDARIGGKTEDDFYRSKYPKSFRPSLSESLLDKAEPQALLLGYVGPEKILGIWFGRERLSPRDAAKRLRLAYHGEDTASPKRASAASLVKALGKSRFRGPEGEKYAKEKLLGLLRHSESAAERRRGGRLVGEAAPAEGGQLALPLSWETPSEWTREAMIGMLRSGELGFPVGKRAAEKIAGEVMVRKNPPKDLVSPSLLGAVMAGDSFPSPSAASERLWWRVQPRPSRPFSADNAYSWPWGQYGEVEPRRGYSAMPSAWELVRYFNDRAGIGDDSDVVMFSGRSVGVGDDNEDLVIPTGRITVWFLGADLDDGILEFEDDPKKLAEVVNRLGRKTKRRGQTVKNPPFAHSVPSAVRQALANGVELAKAGYGGKGLLERTVDEAREIARTGRITLEKQQRMRAWLARHGARGSSTSRRLSDKRSPAWTAWQLWGGDAAVRWLDRGKR